MSSYKVKNLRVAVLFPDILDKVVILKERSMVNRVVKFCMGADNEYREVFTGKSVWISQKDTLPFAWFLDASEMKPKMTDEELRYYYQKKESNIKGKMLHKTKIPIGFKG